VGLASVLGASWSHLDDWWKLRSCAFAIVCGKKGDRRAARAGDDVVVKEAIGDAAFWRSRPVNILLYAGDLPCEDEANEGVLNAEEVELLAACLRELILN
jgi:hypothetical protein